MMDRNAASSRMDRNAASSRMDHGAEGAQAEWLSAMQSLAEQIQIFHALC
jgi:hypothetical protein